MSRNLETSLTIRFKDQVTSAGSKALQTLAKQATATERAVEGIAKTGRSLAATASAPQTVSRAMLELARQSKIAEQALGGVATKGAMLGRTPAPTSTLSGLRQMIAQAQLAERAMRGLGNATKAAMSAAGTGLRGYGSIMAGTAAGGAVLASPMRRVASYDMRLAHMANTAFNETEVDGRKLSVDEQLQRRRAGKGALESYIRAATQEGGTRDDNAAALDKLIARGIFSPTEAGKLLPMISKAATAAGSSADEMTDVVMAAVQNAKIPVEQIPKALGMALKAGQMGGHELKDMAIWLPKMLAMGGLSGLRGTDGLASILAVSQLAVTSAGSSDEAGNNVVNFLQKITSADTAADMKKISAKSFGDKKKGEKGIDLYGTLAKARQEGVDPVEAFTRLVRKVAESDKEFTRLKKMADDAKTDKDKAATYGSMADILQARGVGKTIQDRQAMLALLPMLFDPKAYRDMKSGILNGGAQDVETNQLFIKEQAGYKFQQAENTKDQGEYDSIGKFNNTVGDIANKLAEYGAKYPGLTSSITGATVALNALAAAAGAGLLVNVLSGGKIPGLPKPAPTPGAPAGGTKPARPIGRAPGLAFGTSVVALASFSTDEENEELTNGKGKWKQLRSQYSQATIDAARKKFQPWYQFGDGYAAENEKWLQQYTKRNVPNPVAPLTQLEGGQQGGYANKLDLAATKMQAAANTPQIVHVKGELRMNGADLVAAIDQRQTTTARRQ
ncbi:phage tail tape measure protein [Microvirgula aerodenitrificans]|uniref:phage tail tape measure protein n=1 Tax=Microvirgula aerodenitrificans TaxID=57480 RepID=UPI0028E7BF78|nr:phage tail tape measure protein [Microvirgula aerodenitrificans]